MTNDCLISINRLYCLKSKLICYTTKGKRIHRDKIYVCVNDKYYEFSSTNKILY